MREGFYFGAGPAALPTDVVKQAAEQFVEYEHQGVGLGEISHRSKQATQIINDAKAKVIDIFQVPDTHEVLFVPGGGTGGFAAVIYNLMAAFAARTGKKGKADYLVTGTWSSKGAAEAKRLGIETNIVFDGKKDGKFREIPDQSEWKFSDPAETAFVYFCDNETVDGIEFPQLPQVPEGSTLVMDMSSNMFSRKVDVSKLAVLFGGAQKNVGIAGVSLYIVRKDLLQQAPPAELAKLGVPIGPSVFDFTLIAKNNSAYNTVSIFAVQVINLVLGDLIAKGGLAAQEKESQAKADKIYALVDARPDLYLTTVVKAARSRMNIVFNLPDAETEERFLKGANDLKLTGLKGHRSVGGIRVSSYNAITPEAIDQLAEYMANFN